MKSKYLKIGLNLFLQDPSIIFDLFNSEKNNLNYLFWKPKLKFSNKLFAEIKKDIHNDDKEFLDFLKIIHNKILDLDYFGENIYHIFLYLLIRKTKPKTVVEAAGNPDPGHYRDVIAFHIESSSKPLQEDWLEHVQSIGVESDEIKRRSKI